MAEIEVLQPGLFSSIQDFGRRGFQQFGVPISGVMDRYALKNANVILQNEIDAAVMEITQIGPKLKFSAATRISISGAYLSPKLNGEPVENNEVIKINDGDELAFGQPKLGNRAYLAISGGFQEKRILKSRSWYEGLSDYDRLEKGMTLEYKTTKDAVGETYSSVKFDPEYLKSEEIPVFPGPEYNQLPEHLKLHFQESSFSIDKNSNRMAIQLSERLENELEPIITGPVLPGTVQFTPAGKLIVLMRDCQTTGGYPRVLQLSEDGINMMAQKRAGDKVKMILTPASPWGREI